MKHTRALILCLSLIGLCPGLHAAERAPLEIELVHELGADKGAQLARLVERFNAGNKAAHINISERRWDAPGPQAALMILEDSSEAQLLSKPKRIKPLYEVMAQAREPLQTLAPPRMMTPLVLDERNRLRALPIGLGSPVMYTNRAALQQAGIDPASLPATWQDWQEVFGKLRQAGIACPYTTAEPVSVFIENSSAWNNQAYASTGKNAQVVANGLMQVKHIALMNSWVRGQYLHLFGYGREAEQVFMDGKCASLTASSALLPSLRRAGLDVVVSPLPYHDGAYGAPLNTLADGPSMWIAAGRSSAEYAQIARFVSFWLSAESQVEWQVNAGYLPLNQAGLLAATRSRLLREDLQAIRIAIDELTHKSATNGYASALAHKPGVREVFAEELDAVWTDRKPPKQALDDAVSRIRRLP
ncbi:extracellular solute-binding protein [Uliginosibacterium sediminicola]|uniref:sn-glycerol-3-phosphate-binding periplasmic protein UgpB n=1 Tax=Uliginosibacterium sediminicola TaxID=2024550 RepID=A0ABU9Z3F1_9RHOO